MKIAIRSMITAPPGKVLVAVDLAQAESWVVAYLANEPNMKHSLLNSNIHTDTAGNALFYSHVGCNHTWLEVEAGKLWKCPNCQSEITKTMRYVGKQYNHASAYRMKYTKAAAVINKQSDKPPYVTVTLKESKKYSESWHNYYNVKSWWGNIEKQLSDTRTLITPYGRERIFFDQWGDELFRKATAYVPQSTVADHFNGAVQDEVGIRGGYIEIYRQLVEPYKDHLCINQSHDSCMLEVPVQAGPEILERMKSILRRPLVINGETFTIPTDGEIGERWGEMKAA